MNKVLILLLSSFSLLGYSQTPSDTIDWTTISIEQLMNLKVSVAGKTESEIKTTPGIITVISSEDIKNNQCRDLVDVFNMVPGFAISKDDDYTSFTSRGLYAFEGRALILIDGNQISDLYFGAFVLGNEIPVHLIDKIEIIRGPGSVTYGGTAELTVIKIITKTGEKVDGIDVSVRHGQLGSKVGHQDVAINAGKKVGAFDVALLSSYSNSLSSGGTGSFLYSGDAVYTHNEKSAGVKTGFFAAKASYKENTNLQVSYTTSTINELFAFGLDSENPDPENNVFASMEEVYKSDRVNYNTFYNLSTTLSHKIALKKIYILPSFQHQYNHPFIKPGKSESIIINRIKPSLLGVYNFSLGEFLLGGEFFNDYSHIDRVEGEPKINFLRTAINETGKDAVSIYNYAAYTNLQLNFLKNSAIKGSFNGGLRIDKNELFDAQLSPRVGLNFHSKKFYTKFLYNNAFRAPLAANNVHSRFGLNPDPEKFSRPTTSVSPERLTSFEIEGSYSFTKCLALTTNVYYQYINNLIEFRFNPDNEDLYSDNGGKMGTKGIETELKYQTKKWNVKLNYSLLDPIFTAYPNPYASAYNQPLGGETYITPDAVDGYSTRNELMAVPYSKIYFSPTYAISKTIKVNVNGLFLSTMWADNGDLTTRKIDNQFIFGTSVSYQKNQITASLSCHDLFNSYQILGTPWYGAPHNTLAYKGREISVSLIYSLF